MTQIYTPKHTDSSMLAIKSANPEVVQTKNTKEEYQFAGVHFCASYLGCQKRTLSNIDELKLAMERAVASSGATILAKVDHVFESPNPDMVGYTCAFVLSESHATIHTYPEVDSCFVDLFTCGTRCSHERFDEVLRGYFQPSSMSFQVINRDTTTKTILVMNTYA